MEINKLLAIIILICVAFSTSKSQQITDPFVLPNPTDILASFVRNERHLREVLNQYTFKREVVLQTLGPDGQVTGEYVRYSQFVFDDKGNRVEQVTFHPPSTIREMRITKEDIQDLAGAQLLGIDISEIGKYRLTPAGEETLEGKSVYVLTIEPSVKPDPYRMRNRFFVGRVWIDAESFQIVKVKGIVQPQGKQRFPIFETWREPIAGNLNLPTRTEADDILRFPKRNVHYRVRVRYYDYKVFASKLKITEIDQPEITKAKNSRERCVKNYSAPPANSYYWPPDTEVKIYFHRGMFTAEQREVLLVAIKDWAEIARHGATGVTFVAAGELNSVANCTNCLGIARQDVHRNDPKIYARFYPLKLRQDGLLISARIDLDFATTSPAALQSFVAHELGHGMGLSDCAKCKKKKTIMKSFPGINRDNGLIAASNCDVEVVKEVYELQRRIDKNSTTATSTVQPQ
jgi:hypothetical protein